MIRPRSRATPARGRNTSGSTPTGTTTSFSGEILWSRQMSSCEDCETVSIRCSRCATLVCMAVKEYQRLLANRSSGR